MIRRVLESIIEQEENDLLPKHRSIVEIENLLTKRGWVPGPYVNLSEGSYRRREWRGPYEHLVVVIDEGIYHPSMQQIRNGESDTWIPIGTSVHVENYIPPLITGPSRMKYLGSYSFSTLRGMLEAIKKFAKEHNLKYRGKRT